MHQDTVQLEKDILVMRINIGTVSLKLSILGYSCLHILAYIHIYCQKWMFEKGPFGSIHVLTHFESPHECNEENATPPCITPSACVCWRRTRVCIRGMPENVCLCTSWFSLKVCKDERKCNVTLNGFAWHLTGWLYCLEVPKWHQT